jgi:hypothetical protein
MTEALTRRASYDTNLRHLMIGHHLKVGSLDNVEDVLQSIAGERHR